MADNVPQVAPAQPAPVSVHATPLFSASFCTVAEILCVLPVCIEAVAGFTLTVTTAAKVTVIVVVTDLVVSATDVAFAVIVAGAGTTAGAV